MRLFVYLSEILGQKVVDSHGRKVGVIQDISVHIKEEVFPRAKEIILRKGIWIKKYISVPIEQFRQMDKDFILTVLAADCIYQKQCPRPELSLCRDILDQQVVDTNGRKVVRVNDIHLLRVDNQIYLAHVDVGLRGLVRRLDWEPVTDGLIRIIRPHAAYLKEEELISWKYTHVLSTDRHGNVLKSDVEGKKLAKIPSAELADIMEDLDVFEKLSLFKTFTIDLQRRVFTDMTIQEKEELIDHLDDRDAGNLLENIPADEATDLLHNLPKDRRYQLMRFMHSKTSKELRKLLGFAQDSAGGLMTTEYLYLKSDATVKDAMDLVKRSVDKQGNIYNIYIVDEQHRLMGMTALRRFIHEPDEKPLMETCYPSRIFVRTDSDMEEIALLLEKYKFFAIPVLDEQDVLQGIITTDDVMEELISMAWQKYRDQL